ncbi:MAG TPA: MFS transporter [Pseudolysinimonas sp.]|nr:MFS transporter [Pseudolysinimonas sp.]
MTTTSPPARPIAWRNAVFVTFSLNGFGISAWVARIPSIRDHLHITVAEVGILIVGVSVGSVIGLILAGHIVHWLGGRQSIRVALIVAGAALAGVGFGTTVLSSFGVVLASLVLYGFCSAICDVAMNVEGAAVERASGRTIMPLFHASWSLGTVVGAGLGAVAAFAGIDPVWHLGVIAVVLIVAVPIVAHFIPDDDHLAEDGTPAARLTFRDRMAIWLEPRTLLIGLIVLGMAFTEGSANDWLALAMVDGRHVDNGQGALLFGVFTVSMTLGRIVGGPLIDRVGRVVALRASGAAAAIGLAIVILVPSVPVAVAGIVLWGIGASLGFPMGMSAAGDDPTRAAARVSAVATIGYLAFLVGPPLIGFVGDRIGLLNALWIVLALILLAVFAAPAARERVGRFARPVRVARDSGRRTPGAN